MTNETPRLRRVAEQIQRELADIIRDEIRDPRVGSVTVSGVEVARDLGHARVYMTVLGGDAAAGEEAATVLNRAGGFLRRELGRRVRLRSVPALRFSHDPSFDRGARLSELIDRAVADDDNRDD
ncbi:MAG: 30S ribosome-binding factor RbfA [Ectothiorhodospiraceae bacterium]